jgi:hypothetical protein
VAAAGSDFVVVLHRISFLTLLPVAGVAPGIYCGEEEGSNMRLIGALVLLTTAAATAAA